jgi:hypothetical protein
MSRTQRYLHKLDPRHFRDVSIKSYMSFPTLKDAVVASSVGLGVIAMAKFKWTRELLLKVSRHLYIP